MEVMVEVIVPLEDLSISLFSVFTSLLNQLIHASHSNVLKELIRDPVGNWLQLPPDPEQHLDFGLIAV
jgi:hypothetical protein